jgi:hypothetical protein
MTHNGDFLHSPMFYFVAYKGFQNYHRGYHTGGESFFFFLGNHQRALQSIILYTTFLTFLLMSRRTILLVGLFSFFSWDRDFT